MCLVFASQLVRQGSIAGSAGLQAWSAPSCPGASQGFLVSHLCLCLQGVTPEDFSNFPPEQRRKKLQQKVDDLNKEIQKETDQRDAITKMKDVYLKNPQMGDPASLDHKLTEVTQNIEKLRLEAQKFEVWRKGRSGKGKGKGVSGQTRAGTLIPTLHLFSGRCYRRAGLCPRRGKPPD